MSRYTKCDFEVDKMYYIEDSDAYFFVAQCINVCDRNVSFKNRHRGLRSEEICFEYHKIKKITELKEGIRYRIMTTSGKTYTGRCLSLNRNSIRLEDINKKITLIFSDIYKCEYFFIESKKIEKDEENDMRVKGVSKDEPIVTNNQGGKQSKSLYRLDLVPPLALLKVGEELSKGLEHYPPDNWKLISVEDHLNHALIHLYAWIAGDKSDDHLSHATCRLLFATDIEEKNKQ